MCDNGTILTVVLAILGGSIAGAIGGNLLFAIDMAMRHRHAQQEARGYRRRAQSMAYVSDDGICVGMRVIVGIYDGKAMAVPDSYQDSGDNYRVHVVSRLVGRIACLEPLSATA